MITLSYPRNVHPIVIGCLFSFLSSLTGCQGVLNRTVNNIPILPEGSKVSTYSGGGSLGSKWTRDGQCQVLLDWLNKIKEEYPNLGFDNRGGTPPQQYYINLFRDSSFVPVFGISYKAMDGKTKEYLWRSIMFNNGCIGIGMFKKYQQQFDPYRGILNHAFNAVSYGSQQISSASDAVNHEEKEMNEALRIIHNASTTIQDFRTLQQYSQPTQATLVRERNKRRMRGSSGQREIDPRQNITFRSLWPSEIKSFQAALDKKLELIAGKLAEQSLAEGTSLPISLINARKIKDELIPQVEDLVSAVESFDESQSPLKPLQAKLDGMIASLAKAKISELERIPNMAEGLEESLKWHADFQRDFSEFNNFSDVKRGESVFTQKRDVIFQNAKPAFEKKIKTLGPDLGNLARADEILNSAFSLAADQTLPSYQEYARMVKIHQDWMLTQLLQRQLDKLRKIPSTLSGAIDVLKWKVEFDQTYAPYKHFSPVQSVDQEWSRKRQTILQVAKDEFIKRQHALPQGQESARIATEMLDEIFPNLEDERLPIYEEYKAVVLSTIKNPAQTTVKAHTNSHNSIEDIQKAAEQGDAKAQFALAELLSKGTVINLKEEALRWYHKAAEQGHSLAQQKLYFVYLGKNNEEALKWLQVSAEGGHPVSQYILGINYLEGIGGIAKDMNNARFWIKKAADGGIVEARSVLQRIR